MFLKAFFMSSKANKTEMGYVECSPVIASNLNGIDDYYEIIIHNLEPAPLIKEKIKHKI
jgi:hypothetical protein